MRLRAPVHIEQTRSRPRASSTVPRLIKLRALRTLDSAGARTWFCCGSSLARVRAEIKYEDASDGSGTFPHIYGPINTDAVARVTQYREQAGAFPPPRDPIVGSI
jgi:hypothetical protein